jgi:cytochrome c-type biogenesis protein CcmE
MSGKRTRRRTVLGVGLLIIVGAFAYLMYSGIGNNLVYFVTPSELLAKGNSAFNTPVRLGGQVLPGSVQWNKDTMRLQFRITDGGTPPAMFRPGIGVVVEGHYTRAGVFDANRLMVKHSDEYHPPTKGEKPEEMYRTLILQDGSR